MPAAWNEKYAVQLQAALRKLHDQMCLKDEFNMFKAAVTDDIAPMYSKIITRPMDFGTMWTRIDEGMYGSFDEYAADYNLTLENCMEYNTPDTEYHKVAKKLLKNGKRKISDDKKKYEKWVAQNRPKAAKIAPQKASSDAKKRKRPPGGTAKKADTKRPRTKKEAISKKDKDKEFGKAGGKSSKSGGIGERRGSVPIYPALPGAAGSGGVAPDTVAFKVGQVARKVRELVQKMSKRPEYMLLNREPDGLLSGSFPYAEGGKDPTHGPETSRKRLKLDAEGEKLDYPLPAVFFEMLRQSKPTRETRSITEDSYDVEYGDDVVREYCDSLRSFASRCGSAEVDTVVEERLSKITLKHGQEKAPGERGLDEEQQFGASKDADEEQQAETNTEAQINLDLNSAYLLELNVRLEKRNRQRLAGVQSVGPDQIDMQLAASVIQNIKYLTAVQKHPKLQLKPEPSKPAEGNPGSAITDDPATATTTGPTTTAAETDSIPIPHNGLGSLVSAAGSGNTDPTASSAAMQAGSADADSICASGITAMADGENAPGEVPGSGGAAPAQTGGEEVLQATESSVPYQSTTIADPPAAIDGAPPETSVDNITPTAAGVSAEAERPVTSVMAESAVDAPKVDLDNLDELNALADF